MKEKIVKIITRSLNVNSIDSESTTEFLVKDDIKVNIDNLDLKNGTADVTLSFKCSRR